MRIKKRSTKRNVDMAKLSEEIIKFRKENNISMEEFSEKIGLSLSTVFRVENKKISSIYCPTKRAFQNYGFKL